MNENYNHIIKLFKEKYLKDISVFQNVFIELTLKSRMTETKQTNLYNYIDLINKDKKEALDFFNALKNTYTEFFRNPLTFGFLENILLPKILNKDETINTGLRIWSAGCSSGEESYSLLMLFYDFINIHSLSFDINIFATDNSTIMIEKAKKGLFNKNNVKNIKIDYINKYFDLTTDCYLIKDFIKKYINFSQYDLLEEESNSPPESIYGDFDLIMCCNLLLYYNWENQKKIIEKFYSSLKTDKYLIVGEVEIGIIKRSKLFYQIAEYVPIFIKA
ncbi:MAG: CheR family methyltransferase [bacterium]